MADEILVKSSLVYSGKVASNGPSGFTVAEESWSIDQTGDDYTKGTQTLNSTTAEELIVSSDIGIQGLWEIRHLSTSGIAKIGVSGQTAGEMTMKINAGDPPLKFRANAPVYGLVSSAAAPVKIEFVCFEE